MRMKILGSSAIAAAILVVGAAVTPGLAQEAEKEENSERIIIVERGKHDKDAHGPGHALRIRDKDGKGEDVRVVHIHKRGEGDWEQRRRMHGIAGTHMALADCVGDKAEIDEGDDKQKTRIVLCGDSKLSPAERAAKLEEIRAKLGEREGMSAEHRAKVEAALTEAINRLRATN
jgi:hypothetical protein